MANNSIDSVQIIADSIDNVHMSNNSIDSAQIISDAIDNVHISNNAIQSAQLNINSVTNVKVSDNAINTLELVIGSVETLIIDGGAVTTAKRVPTIISVRNATLVSSSTSRVFLNAFIGSIISHGLGVPPITTIKQDSISAPSSLDKAMAIYWSFTNASQVGSQCRYRVDANGHTFDVTLNTTLSYW